MSSLFRCQKDQGAKLKPVQLRIKRHRPSAHQIQLRDKDGGAGAIQNVRMCPDDMWPNRAREMTQNCRPHQHRPPQLRSVHLNKKGDAISTIFNWPATRAVYAAMQCKVKRKAKPFYKL